MQPLSGNQRPDLLTDLLAAPATRNASFQILFTCPTPAIVFGNARSPHVLLTFDKMHNPLRRPRGTTPEHPKMLRSRQFFALLTWKCASHNNRMHFFDISTLKNAPTLVCFVHFALDLCFAPQRRALVQRLNFQKWSEIYVFCAF